MLGTTSSTLLYQNPRIPLATKREWEQFEHIFDRLKNRQFNTPYNLKDDITLIFKSSLGLSSELGQY